MERVLIVGCPGAGKSTAAKLLAAKTGLPIVHLDYYYWLPGWVPVDKALWRQTVSALAGQSRWIIDGNYGSTLEERTARADTVIHLDFATWLCFWRVIRRTITNLGKERQGEFVSGCPERFDPAFLRFVLRYRRHHRARDMAKLAEFGGHRLTFTRPADLTGFIDSIR